MKHSSRVRAQQNQGEETPKRVGYVVGTMSSSNKKIRTDKPTGSHGPTIFWGLAIIAKKELYNAYV